MNKNTNIQCPNCQEVFKVDESVYTDIVKQVRDQQFNDELTNRLQAAANEKKAAVELAESKIKSDLEKQLTEKENEIQTLTLKTKAELTEQLAKKQQEIDA